MTSNPQVDVAYTMLDTTAATISVAISSGGGLFHAEYVVVVEGGLAWTALGGFSAVQINVDLVDWDAFFYGAWRRAVCDIRACGGGGGGGDG
ncbi:hypothetical protein Ctob_016399 [Chrysochromulina tobinii]|uniref:Uncharacterized protein n=1 Tax=Chrysochromulina tobinii TaxID=1460289 RepID=A0A0M0K5U4_9EUKA|nr:hypothetical protein Ctob_016399 [Chrysochromulina tobinii]|eukprot:KOO33942.1 hypothetical protein Ctob_016399 [Chrysochromulina sp. CCMP291]